MVRQTQAEVQPIESDGPPRSEKRPVVSSAAQAQWLAAKQKQMKWSSLFQNQTDSEHVATCLG